MRAAKLTNVISLEDEYSILLLLLLLLLSLLLLLLLLFTILHYAQTEFLLSNMIS